MRKTILLFALTLITQQISSGQVSDRETRGTLHTIRRAGVLKDTTKAVAIREICEGKITEQITIPSLRALVRMDDTETLSLAQNIVTRSPLISISVNARCIAARIVSENAVKNESGRAKAIHFLSRYLRELSLNPSEWAALMRKEDAERKATTSHSQYPSGVGTVALREIADKIYHDNDSELLSVCRENQVPFDVEEGIKRKIRYAELPRARRANALIEDLSRIRAFTRNEYFTVQLAADEGQTAIDAVLLKLIEMDIHPGNYRASGYIALFRVLKASTDNRHSPILSRYIGDARQGVAHHAKNIQRDLLAGGHFIFESNY